jgi:hypothetical protein
VKEERQQLIDLKFVCDVGGQRFGVCADKAALCQVTTYKKTFLGIKVKTYTAVIKEISLVDKYDQLLNANTYCAAQESDLGKEMF